MGLRGATGPVPDNECMIKQALVGLFLASSFSDVGGAGCESCDDTERVGVALPPSGTFEISVFPVRLADDDGSSASTLTEAKFLAWLDSANAVFSRSGVPLRFKPSEQADFSLPPLRSTLMNHDCVPTEVDPKSVKVADANGDGFVDANDNEVFCVSRDATAARFALGRSRPAEVTLILRAFAERAEFNKATQQWRVRTGAADFGYSGTYLPVVVVGPDAWSGNFLAHELGHYFHLPHTHNQLPRTVAEAEALITAHIQTGSGMTAERALFEGDLNFGVEDTPADPGPEVFAAIYGNACLAEDKAGDVTLSQPSGQELKLHPQRDLVMSYFKECGFAQRFSAGQRAKMLAAIQGGNRSELAGQQAANLDVVGGVRSDRDSVPLLPQQDCPPPSSEADVEGP